MRLRSILASVAATAMAAISLPMAAQAAPGNTVVFGDSLIANPSVADYAASKIPGLPNPKISKSGCPTDFLFSGTYGATTNRPTDDYTCAGASFRTGGMRIDAEIQRAIDQGDLNPQTSEIVILAGANDTYPYVLNERMPVPQIRENLRVAVRDAVNKAKHHAPNARVKLVGYPRIGTPTGEVCVVNTTPGPGVPTLGVNVKEVEDGLQWAVVDAARDTGSLFVDSKGISAGHEMCSPDRWVAGIIDTTAGPHNLILHMTNDGLSAVARNAALA
ncbi:hypothetical protein KRX51_08980 [Corynebacterium sp. TAE3-ERU12]|uniref:GDSL-type esterase/lipase family protein n=1 Tax=Corynebacterium sp. TAE3-ERU12 TaxID=2849491 RepID=UPI001C489894|nr:GDSL-type esterase/lipase family protein [Corynebacterium sp. TAE3-ERU12]MBV7296042.1 hypothetical protein [Corynebacterium sp. TAE3-ERU12]